MNGDNVRMIEGRSRLCFFQKATLGGEVVVGGRRQQLYGNGATESRIIRLINITHAPAANLFGEPVV